MQRTGRLMLKIVLYNMGMFELLEKQKITATGLIVAKQRIFDQATLTVVFLN